MIDSDGPIAALPDMAEFRAAIAYLREILGDPAYESLARKDDDHHHHGDLRIRPNRPGPNKTGSGLEIDDIGDSLWRTVRRRILPCHDVSKVRLRKRCRA